MMNITKTSEEAIDYIKSVKIEGNYQELIVTMWDISDSKNVITEEMSCKTKGHIWIKMKINNI